MTCTIYLTFWEAQMHGIDGRHLILLLIPPGRCQWNLQYVACNIGVVPFTPSSTYTNIIFLNNQVLQTFREALQ